MGEEKKEETKEEEKKEEKKEEEAPEIVLKVDMHCEACARKVARALKGFQGVEEVRTDSKAGKVVVKGKAAEPVKVYERLQKKSGRKVELISPLPKQPTHDKNDEEKQEPPPEEAIKEEPPRVVTVVLNVRMHCEACAQLLQKRIRKIKGVESVETDLAKDQVIVKGVVDPAMLVSDVYKRTKKQAVIVKDEEKKEEDEIKKEEKKEEEKKEEKKKEEEKTNEGEGNENNKEEDEKKNNDNMKRIEHWPSRYHTDYAYVPQMFSDENPNACSIM